MRGADAVNDKFEVGFNQHFEPRWHRAEIAGRLLLTPVARAMLGLLGRGSYGRNRHASADGVLAVDLEPIARHGTATTNTADLHVPPDGDEVRLLVSQSMVEPLGLQHATPLPARAVVTDKGSWLYWPVPPGQSEVLIQLVLKPGAVGPVPGRLSDGTRARDGSVLVLP